MLGITLILYLHFLFIGEGDSNYCYENYLMEMESSSGSSYPFQSSNTILKTYEDIPIQLTEHEISKNKDVEEYGEYSSLKLSQSVLDEQDDLGYDDFELDQDENLISEGIDD